MSSQDSKPQDVPEAAPSVAETESTNQDGGTMPAPITDEDDTQSPDRAEQSWENFDSEQQAEPEQVSENPSSAFSDSSDESPAQSPTDPNQEAADDLFSDDEEDRPPPPRPEIPLAPSVTQKHFEEHPEPSRSDDEFGSEHIGGILDSNGVQKINNHWGRYRRVRRDRTTDFGHGQSSMSLVLQPSDQTSSGFTIKDTDAKGKKAPAQIPLPLSPDDNRSDYVDHKQDGESSELGQAGQSVDENFSDVQREAESLQLIPQDWTFASGSGEAATTAADFFDRELLEEAERNRRNHSQDEEDPLPTLDDTPMDYGAAEQVETATADSQEQPSRPVSPITGFYDSQDSNVYYQTPEEDEQEFDDLMEDESGATPGTVRRSSSEYDDESPESPQTPTSAEILERVTGMSPEYSMYKFDRLTELAKTTAMQNPQRALKMQRYMLQIIEGSRNDVVAHIGEYGTKVEAKAKVKVKAKTAWAAAAAHHYRHQRNESRREQEETRGELKVAREISWEWESWGRRQHERNEELSAENRDLDEGYQRARDDLDQAELDKTEAEQKAQEAHDQAQAVKDAGAQRDKRMAGLEKQAKQITPLWDRKIWLEKNPPKDADTQTNPTSFQSEQATQTQQTENPTSEDGVSVQTEAETSSAVSSKGSETDATVDAGTQTAPGTVDAESQGRTRATAARMDVPRLRFELGQNARSTLTPDIVRWINERHAYHRGDPEVAQVTSERIDSLLNAETTYNDFVSALQTDGHQFRPDHLASYIEQRINEDILGLVPLAILQYLRPIVPRSMAEDLTTVYNEIAQQQVQINQLENSFARDRATAVAPLNSDPEALELLRNHIAGLGGDVQDADVRAKAERVRAQTAEEKSQRLQEQKDALANELTETRQLLDETLNERNKTPSPTTTSPTNADDAGSERADKLESELKSWREHGEQLQKSIDDADIEKDELKINLNDCRIHGEQIQKYLDDADSEKEQLNDSLKQCQKHGEQLQAANSQLDKDVAYWKAEYDEMERRKLQSDDTAIAYQMKYEPVSDLSDDSEDGKDEGEGEGDEMAKLRAEVERLNADNERLSTANDQAGAAENADAPSAELDALKQENESFRNDNARYKDILNAAASVNRKALTIARPDPIATNLPLRTAGTSNNLQTPAAIPLPHTPAPPTGATGAALPTGNSLLRPTELRTPRTAAPPLPPINASSMPERWLARERQIQSTNAFWENKRKIMKMIQERDLKWEEERELDRARANRTAHERLEALGGVS